MKKLVVLLALATGCSSPAPAKPSDPVPGRPEEELNLPKDPPAEFTLEPGDVLSVAVYRQKEMDQIVRVPGTGSIQVPLIGAVPVVGRTAEEVREEIAKKLGERFLVNPQVAVQVTQYAPRRVYVLGEVRAPRETSIPEGGRLYLLQLISAAGGLQASASARDVKLIRTTRENRSERKMYKIPLHRIESGEVPDILLTSEDVVIIPAEVRMVYVLGAVKNPNGYAMPTSGSYTVTQAIASAGGLGKFASAGGVQILRQGPDRKQITYTVDVARVLAGDLAQDRELQPGDIVVVPSGLW
jgi:polysaccharide export outer membrane protein